MELKDSPDRIVERLGLKNAGSTDLVDWDVFEAVLTPGATILLTAWKDKAAAEKFSSNLTEKQRLRRIRVVRGYGMFDRREAPPILLICN
jgi:hypothetical protein